jgi:hypothetical protein
VGKRLPHGWKRREEEHFCPACWQQRYVLRVITMSVASPPDGDWKALNAQLRPLWRQATACHNWMMTELAKNEGPRLPSMDKLPPMGKTYLYPEARKLFPLLPPQSVACIEHAVTRTYKALRLEVIWRHSGSLPSFRYPQPLHVHNQSWKAEWDETGERPQLRVRLAEGWIALRLRGGSNHRRQLQGFRQMVEGVAVRCELAIVRPVKGGLRLRMAAWLPRTPHREKREGTLYVLTAPGCLLLALDAKGETLWTYHADQVVRWSLEHRERLQRWSDDQKFEARPDIPFAARRKAAARKYRNRMHSAVQQAAAYVAGYAQRRRFACVRYDDSGRSWFPGFPWHEFRERVASKLDELGIQFGGGENHDQAKSQPTVRRGSDGGKRVCL